MKLNLASILCSVRVVRRRIARMKLPWIAWVSASLLAPVTGFAGEARVAATSLASAGEWSSRVEALVASRSLQVRQVREDTMIPGRRHERLAQLYRGVPVFGAELVRQSDAAGALTVFGTLHEGIELDVVPRLS